MTADQRSAPAVRRAGWLTLGICVAVAALAWFGYRATREWQRSAALLVDRRAGETADLLATALARDMRGVQSSVLMALHWDQVRLDPPYALGDIVARAFARYPYPESFFAWDTTAAKAPVVFFSRANRLPVWWPATERPRGFPVTVLHDPAEAADLVRRISADAQAGRRFSIFDTRLGGEPYQIVARLLYRDPQREQLASVFGFTTNLAWTRRHYFADLATQVGRIAGSSEGLALAILDHDGERVVGLPAAAADGPVKARGFLLLFCDPLLVALDAPVDLARHEWVVQVTAAQSPLLAAVRGANITLAVAALAAIGLGVGFVLTGRAVRASAEVAEMRSDFVSTVTHELKTPLATIRAVGDTLVRGRVSGPEALAHYAQLLVQESRRLTRLVDNLLAYSRITDISDVYTFEAIAPRVLIDEALRGFAVPLAEQGFRVTSDVPDDLPAVRADRAAMQLALDNLIDNAMRYSKSARTLAISGTLHGTNVAIAIGDCGQGIAPADLERVTRKFVRGREAGSSGSGLGLAIAKRIVEDHDGTLAIVSTVGQGTTVTITLPVEWTEDEATG